MKLIGLFVRPRPHYDQEVWSLSFSPLLSGETYFLRAAAAAGGSRDGCQEDQRRGEEQRPNIF